MKRIRQCLRWIGIVIIVFVALESALRIWDICTKDIVSEEVVSQYYRAKTRTHPFLEYTARPSFTGNIKFSEPAKKFSLATNAHGFRTHEFYPKLPGQFRVVLLGDSFVFGVNANQDETIAAQLEKRLQERVSKNIEVFSLGVSSYSGLRYAMLSKLYFDFLQPDLVIVNLDASDFEEDRKRLSDYVLDDAGEPLVLRYASQIIEDQKQDRARRLVIDATGQIRTISDDTLFAQAMLGSSLLRRLFLARDTLVEKIDRWKVESALARGPQDIKKLNADDDLASKLPARLLVDVVPAPLETAISRYQPTLMSMRVVQRACNKINATMYLATYPYPWMVSVEEAIDYQLSTFGAIYDLRDIRTHPKLVDRFANELSIKHLNGYPVFEAESKGLYGQFDPHFNARGYERYAEFLFQSIYEEVTTRFGAR